jgi:hypothetical protein
MTSVSESESSASEIDNEDAHDEVCTMLNSPAATYSAFLFAALALLLLALGTLGHGGIPVVILSLPFLFLAAFAIRSARFMDADIVINKIGVFRKRGEITYQAVHWTDVSAIELGRGGGVRGSPTYSVYRIILKSMNGGKRRRGLGVSRPLLSNPGRLIRLLNEYSLQYDIPIFLNEGFTKRKLDQIPYEEIDWDPLSIALSGQKRAG